MRTILYSIIVLFLLDNTAFSQKFKLGELFNEGIVFQQKTNALVWGKAEAAKDVVIQIQDKSYKTVSDKNGNWTITLKNLKVGGPFSLISYCATDTIKLNEVYVGEVWIAGGQSNMAFQLEKSDGGKQELASAKNTNIRFVLVPAVAYEGDRTRGDMNWHTATTENAGAMSGAAYFFAKKLQEKLNVPIGIICCYKGGTAAETWMSREKLMQNKNHSPIVTYYEDFQKNIGKEPYNTAYNKYEKDLKIYFDSVKTGFRAAVRPVEPMGEKHYKRPYGLYNTMLKRIIPYTAKGVIWYQGEANAPRAEQYQTLFPALISEWRSDFKNPKMPFYFAQLSNYNHPSYGTRPMWAELREAQLLTWKKVKNTGMAVTIDVGNKNDIHPTDKKPVGERLAAIAIQQAYGLNLPYSGPLYKSVKMEGNKAVLSFDFIYSGLTSKGELKGFSICGADKKFVSAKAEIIGDKIVVSSEAVNQPIAVRYGWSNWTEANLFNKEEFPASPFRTDNFELLSHGVKTTNY
jgi:sialate O-acetylesterase